MSFFPQVSIKDRIAVKVALLGYLVKRQFVLLTVMPTFVFYVMHWSKLKVMLALMQQTICG